MVTLYNNMVKGALQPTRQVVAKVTYRGGAVGVGGVVECAGVACSSQVPPEEQLSGCWR